MKPLLCALLALAAAAALGNQAAQGQTPASRLAPPAGETTLQPKLGCADLRSLTGYEFTVESAVLIPASDDRPEYCRVRGQILPEIRFEVDLPATWNRRFYMYGNGGYAGESLDSPQRGGARVAGLRGGFVVASTDTGHDAATEPLATFAQNRQKLLDYAFRSLHTTAETGKQIATAYYGSKPTRSYFEGCSTGGRQALILAQRFPDDFDGVIAGAPVLNFTGQGKRIFPGWPISSEVAGPNGRSGWDFWKINQSGQPSISIAFGETFLKYMAFPDKNSKTDLANFEFDKDPPRLEWIHNILDATDPDLSRFKQRGGQTAKYKGSGSIDDAANFVCQ
jgi:hypothetical protein